MALSSSGLKTSIINKLTAAGFNTTSDKTKTDAFVQAIAEAVVDEIKANAVVTHTGTTACPAGAGTESGSGTIA